MDFNLKLRPLASVGISLVSNFRFLAKFFCNFHFMAWIKSSFLGTASVLPPVFLLQTFIVG